ncbi:CARDB domain-containing protein [Cohnella sp. 56]|uniref:CARDB domain-containing protein n=1 Tax=Cohnella sp. 56 TaxID=3113722 RepID=UPI0030E864CC
MADRTDGDNGAGGLEVALIAGHARAVPGETIFYAVRVTNTGSLAACNVCISDTLSGDSACIPGLAAGESVAVPLRHLIPASAPPGARVGEVIARADGAAPGAATYSIVVTSA